MNMPRTVGNVIYVGIPIVLCAVMALGKSHSIGVFFGHLLGLLLWPTIICAAIYDARRKRSFYWQRWFFWLGLLLPSLAYMSAAGKN